jgi:hypothetical protein
MSPLSGSSRLLSFSPPVVASRPVTYRVSWRTIDVRQGELALAGRARLAALFRLLRDESTRDLAFIDSESGRPVERAVDVHWALFPLQEAIEAVESMKWGESA